MAPYWVAAGKFLPVDPLVVVQFGCGGVASVDMDRAIASIAGDDWDLWDPNDADAIWSSQLGNRLVGDEFSISEIAYDLRGDVASESSYTAAIAGSGIAMAADTWAADGAWVVLAMRAPLTETTGSVLGINTTSSGAITATLDGNRMAFSVDGTVFATHPRDLADATVTLISITTHSNGVVIGVREGERLVNYSWSSDRIDDLYPLEVVVGGIDSPEMAIYAVARGYEDRAKEISALIGGFLSC